ncbi:serine/threonine protein kinase [Streptomyces sp. NBC_01750]|uniref:serine/threonine protein kinase n=1 Tax=Streptomyces sp. NBC_01750 TaxID=2975928 RepID=UPI002DDC8D21|nr:protein kinase [Streptomyces sp. NBC_01750]WSD31075.1 protein kinase [Streptomyces sp. NBC_01750]
MTAGEANGGELIGKVLGGRYRVTAMVGRGGMGVVGRAVDELLNREVAVKILRAYTDASASELADLRSRMQREAQAAARIRHSGVVTVHDVTEEQGLPVIVMELVDGPSLDDVLTERGTLEPREAAAIGAKLMDALDAAHRVGVLHRDVKPGNVLLERGGRVVLTDFGIASMEASDDDAMTKLTQSGQIVGSLDYLPPERAQGREPGPASDIWSLGMTLYAAVEGTSPFRRTSAWSTLAAIVTEPLPEPRRAGPLTAVLQALMAKEPEGRPTADQAREMLERVAAGSAANLAPRTPTRTPTQAAIPTPPPGFGPAPSHQASPQPGHTGYPPAGLPPTLPQSGAPTPGHAPGASHSAAGRARRRSRTVIATAVAVVLAGGGVTYALVDKYGGTSSIEARTEPPGGSSPAGSGQPTEGDTGVDTPSASPSGGARGKPSDAPSQRTDEDDDGKDSEAGSATTPSSGGGGGNPHSSAPPTTNPSAVYLSNDYSALCAGAGNKVTNSSKVIQWGCANAQDERWVFEATTDSNGKRAYALQNAYSGKCMGPASSLANGAGMVQYTCNGAVDQKWWYDSGTHALRNVYSGKCLGLGSNATKGSQLIQWTCNGAPDEKWSKTAR